MGELGDRLTAEQFERYAELSGMEKYRDFFWQPPVRL